MLPKINIIIINWNGSDDTLDCLASLMQMTYPDFHVLVLDNGSSAASLEVLRQGIINRFPQVELLALAENTGYTGANNIGLARAVALGADYALLLNNDTEVAPDFLARLVEAAEADPKVAMAGPMIYYHHNPGVIWSAGGRIDWAQGDSTMWGEGVIDNGQFGGQPRDVDFVTGCALLVKVPLVAEFGDLDERFFAYYEETEWCLRARRSNYRILHVPLAHVWHKISATTRESSPRVQYYMTRNRLLFLRLANAPALLFFRVILFEYGKRLLSWTIRPKWWYKNAERYALVRALIDFGRGQFGRMPN